MQLFRPGDEKYEELLRGILARLDERARQRRETPELLKLQAELNELEAQAESKISKTMTDDEAFHHRQLQQRCQAIKMAIEHLMDDWHQAERPYRLHRRQFEEALEKHLALKIQSGQPPPATGLREC